MRYFLVIGDVTSAQYAPCNRRDAHIKRVTTHQALEGSSWGGNEAAGQLRKLLGCEPTEVMGVIMPEEVWLNPTNILKAQYDYFTSCDRNMWVVRPDGVTEFV